MATVIEQLSTFTPLGIRFWDAALDRQIRHYLRVEAYPISRPQLRRTAYQTLGDVYSFEGLPRMRHIEFRQVPDAESSSAERHPFVVSVVDQQRRFLPIAFEVELPLPYPGLYLSSTTAGSPAEVAPPGLHLYSSVVRPVPSWVAAVRGELHDLAADSPATHAVIRLETLAGDVWYGLSDKQGRFVVILPYPVLIHGFGGSPADPGQRPLLEQEWDLTLSVQYEPSVLRSLPGIDLPDYLSLLQQFTAGVYQQTPEDGGTPLSGLPITLRFDRNPTVRTEGISQLLVSPSSASP
jgi:hypothetical protein